jgi:lysyl endopeptidase
MLRANKYLLFFFTWIFSAVSAQIPHGGQPYFPGTRKSLPEPVMLPRLALKQAINESLSEEAVNGKKPFSFAWNYDVSFNPENSGVWDEMPDGTRVWRIYLKSEGAYGINLIFSKFHLNSGSVLFLYPADYSFFRGGFNDLNNQDSGILPTDFIPGEGVIAELQTPQGSDSYGSLEIGNVGHAYINLFDKEGIPGSSGSCNVDINCAEGENWQIVKRAVCRITIKTGSSSMFCTGTLVNNTKQDTVPYLLTANHCVHTETQAATAVFLFGYEADTCSKKTVSTTYSLAGSKLLATSDSIDFTLLKLNEIPPEIYKPYFAGWTISSVPAQNAVCIHHPQGDIKKISVEQQTLTGVYQSPIPSSLSWLINESLPEAFWRVVNWETGTTEGGSSGSPLFNQDHLIVGNLTGGQADCSNSVNDYFSKFHVGWNHYSLTSKQLKYWLDPLNTGVTALTGFNPFGEQDTTSIDSTEYADRFILFPNPATETVTFETDSLDLSGGTLSIYSLTGKTIASYDCTGSTKLTFDVSFLQQGLYIVAYSKDNTVERKKLMIVGTSK